MQLWRTDCSTDWKGRPWHSMKLIAQSDHRDRLLEAMDADVLEWQAAEIADYNESLEDGEEPRTKWEDGYDRFEMDRKDPTELRKFSETNEGDCSTTVYHILD